MMGCMPIVRLWAFRAFLLSVRLLRQGVCETRTCAARLARLISSLSNLALAAAAAAKLFCCVGDKLSTCRAGGGGGGGMGDDGGGSGTLHEARSASSYLTGP
jgi:hypothetical protein